jgi:hypothetical protein
VCLDQRKIVVVGVARNCEHTIRGDVDALFGALSSCQVLSWLVIESDSSDKTVEALASLTRTVPGFRFISMGMLTGKIPDRTQRIAYCRNVYLDRLSSDPLYSGIDHVVVADFDGVNNLLTKSAIESCWARSEWDVCTANQRGPYYDIWALRHPLWSPNDCWEQYRFLVEHRTPREIALWAAVYAKMVIIDERGDWIEVDSAFGGLAVYRRRFFSEIQYAGSYGSGTSVCEHVPLHLALKRQGARIFINPRLINTSHTEHSNNRLLRRRIRREVATLRLQATELLAQRRPSARPV